MALRPASDGPIVTWNPRASIYDQERDPAALISWMFRDFGEVPKEDRPRPRVSRWAELTRRHVFRLRLSSIPEPGPTPIGDIILSCTTRRARTPSGPPDPSRSADGGDVRGE